MCGGVGSIIAKGGSNVNPCVKAKLKCPLLGCRGGPAERPEQRMVLARFLGAPHPIEWPGAERIEGSSTFGMRNIHHDDRYL